MARESVLILALGFMAVAAMHGLGAAVEVQEAAGAASGAPAVVVSLGSHTGVAGRELDIEFALSRNGYDVGIFQFVILNGTAYEAVLIENSKTNDIVCDVERDLADDFGVVGVSRPSPGDMIVSLLPNLLRFRALPRDGIFGRCRFRVQPGATAGSYPLSCDRTGLASASSPEGDVLPIVCEDGTLVVRESPECRGDCDGVGGVTLGDLVNGVGVLLGDDIGECRALDVDGDGAGTVDELLLAVRSALEGCS